MGSGVSEKQICSMRWWLIFGLGGLVLTETVTRSKINKDLHGSVGGFSSPTLGGFGSYVSLSLCLFFFFHRCLETVRWEESLWGIPPRPGGEVSPSCAHNVVIEESTRPFERVKGFTFRNTALICISFLGENIFFVNGRKKILCNTHTCTCSTGNGVTPV